MNGTNDQATWRVLRQDDNGNQFLVESGLDEDQARRLARELESHGHKQLYWASRSDGRDEQAG